MSRQGLLLVAASALLTVVSNLVLRSGVTRAGGFDLSANGLFSALYRLASQPLFVLGLILYGLAALVWFRVISTEDLNVSYPLLVGMTFTLVTFGATVLFHEPLSLQRLAGICMILGGIIWVACA